MTQSTQTITPLRQRMIDDMSQRRLDPRTQEAYLRAVIKLTRFLGRSPDAASADDLRRFQLHLAQNGVSNQTINATITGLRFFFEVTLDDHQALRKKLETTATYSHVATRTLRDAHSPLDALSIDPPG